MAQVLDAKQGFVLIELIINNMSIKKVRKHNEQCFLDDLRRVRDVLVFAPTTLTYFRTTKTEVLKESENSHIEYEIRDDIFHVKRDVMVIF